MSSQFPKRQGVADVTIVVTPEDSDVVAVSIQANGPGGSDLSEPVCLDWYFANDALGLTPTTVAHDGGTAIGADGALIESPANLGGKIITEANGHADIEVTDAGAFEVYLVVVLPGGQLVVSDAITHEA